MPKKMAKYQTGFSAGALLMKEADAGISNIQDFEALMSGQEGIDYSVIPVNSESSKKRLAAELNKRLRHIQNFNLLQLYKEANELDKKILLLYSICVTYSMVSDFLIEVVLRKWNNFEEEVNTTDFQHFFYQKVDSHKELENVPDAQVKKLSYMLMLIMRDFGMLHGNQLIKQDFSFSRMLKAIAQNGDKWFLELLFLTEDEMIEIINI